MGRLEPRSYPTANKTVVSPGGTGIWSAASRSATIGRIPSAARIAARSDDRVTAYTASPRLIHSRATRKPRYPQPKISFAITAKIAIIRRLYRQSVRQFGEFRDCIALSDGWRETLPV